MARVIAEEWRKEGETVHYFDLELPAHLKRLEEPQQALVNLSGLVMIDEIQRRPDLFPILRVFADRRPLPARFLVLGSASGVRLRQTRESLAGRIAYVELPGFGVREIKAEEHERLWIRGGFPESFLAEDDRWSYLWREQFIQTFLERDIPSLGVKVEPMQLWRFWQMAPWYENGQRWGFEFKYADAPGTKKSMHVGIESLSLDKVFVIYPGKERYGLTEKIEVVPLCEVGELFGVA